MILSRTERFIAKRYLLPGKSERFIVMVASISLGAVMLGVAALIIVMSVMNGFRAELFDKIVGLNGHAVVQGYENRLENWREILAQARKTPGVVSAKPLVAQPLMVTSEGRVGVGQVRGMLSQDILANKSIADNVVAGNLNELTPNSANVAIGSGLAETIGLQVGSTVSLLNPEGQTTPFGTVPRIVPYRVAAIFQVGVYDYDKQFIVMPVEDAQTLLLSGDVVGNIEIETTNPENVDEILAPIEASVKGRGIISTWRSMNAQLFEALEVDRVVSFVILSIIILVAAFNILSSLIMLVRSKTRDIAILRTMGIDRSSVLKIFMTVGTSIGVLGTMAGMVLGFIFLTFRQSILDGVAAMTGQQLWDPQVRFLAELPSKVDPVQIGWIVAIALIASFLATLYPAFKAASTDPVQVLRYE
jgi:lipoprotein-releasing system permease protein